MTISYFKQPVTRLVNSTAIIRVTSVLFNYTRRLMKRRPDFCMSAHCCGPESDIWNLHANLAKPESGKFDIQLVHP